MGRSGWLIFAVAVLLWSPVVEAQNVWSKLGQPATAATGSVGRGGIVTYNFVLADGGGASSFSPILSAPDCEYVTIQFDPDTASAGGAAEVYLYSCMLNAAPTVNHCGKVLTDTDGDGLPNDATLNGADGTGSLVQRRYIYNVTGLPYLAINRAVAAASTQTAKVILTCGSGN